MTGPDKYKQYFILLQILILYLHFSRKNCSSFFYTALNLRDSLR